MEERKFVPCEHEINDDTKKYIQGTGFIGNCKKCGIQLVQVRRSNVKPRTRPHMSKKQRLRERRMA
jgi:hypothetical protein